MFERYTEQARRAIYFARYEAAQFGSPQIEPAHLILGILRDSGEMLRGMAGGGGGWMQGFRSAIEERLPRTRERVPTSVDLPLSYGTKKVLALGAEEAARVRSQHIGPEHLILGLLKYAGSEATEMAAWGITLEAVERRIIADSQPETPQRSTAPADSSPISQPSQDVLAFLLGKVPRDRWAAAARVLQALGDTQCRIAGNDAEGGFEFNFGI